MSEDENSIITNLEYFLGNEKKMSSVFLKRIDPQANVYFPISS